MTALRAGAASDVGRVRRNNQDQFLVGEHLFAVADGMGGAAGGEEASLTAVGALEAAFEGNRTADGLADGVRDANRAVWEKALRQPELRGMGTTMTAVALVADDDGEVLAVANVGDSRVYLLRDGRLDQITDDHSVPEELVRAGRLTPEEAARHPQRNMLTRVLGNEPDVEVDCFAIVPYAGDRLVLASDGLFNEVAHDDITAVARRRRDPQEAADELVRMARERGGNDNITVVVVDVVDDDDRAAKASAALAGEPAGASRVADGPRGPATEVMEAVRVAPPGQASSPAAGHWSAPRPPRDEDRFEAPAPPRRARERRFTLGVAVFLVALVLVAAGAAGAVGFFARAGYFVGVAGDEVVIYKGRPGGLLWFDPTVERRTGIRIADVTPARAQDLAAGKEEPSLAAALRYAKAIQDETITTTSTSTTTLPLAPTTAVPPSTP